MFRLGPGEVLRIALKNYEKLGIRSPVTKPSSQARPKGSTEIARAMPGPDKDGELGLADGRLYRFGHFLLDARRRTVSANGDLVALTPTAFDLLLFFVQNPHRLIAKEELLQAVWGRRVVEEGNLAQYISHLRKALGENPDHPGLIATIARKGYQFTGDVTLIDAADVAAYAEARSSATGSPGPSAPPAQASAATQTTTKPLPRPRSLV